MCPGSWSRPIELYCPGDAETLHHNTVTDGLPSTFWRINYGATLEFLMKSGQPKITPTYFVLSSAVMKY
jgi:hypothetical protein